MATEPERDEQGQEGEPLAGHAARAAGERLREIADAEHARLEAEEVKHGADELDAAARKRDEAAPHPLAEYAEPITTENLASLGEVAAGMAPCPFCDGYGAVDPDQLIAALPNVIEALAPYPTSTVFVRCDECDGWGSVLTGGRTGDNGIQPCPKCQSHGYIDTREGHSLADVQREVGSTLVTAPPIEGGDPFTTPPPEGVPPAAGMEWDTEIGRWQYPARVA